MEDGRSDIGQPPVFDGPRNVLGDAEERERLKALLSRMDEGGGSSARERPPAAEVFPRGRRLSVLASMHSNMSSFMFMLNVSSSARSNSITARKMACTL